MLITKQNNSSKLCAQRAGEPCFDVVIELTQGELDSWRIAALHTEFTGIICA